MGFQFEPSRSRALRRHPAVERRTTEFAMWPMRRLRFPRRCTTGRDCARCRGLKSADKRWGFDKRAVASTPCLHCGVPIGRRHYRLVTILARFGQMFVVHKNCKGIAT